VNLPNSLTLLRIFIVPVLVAVLLTPLSEHWLGVPRHIAGLVLFLAASFTDFLDGHLARSRNQVSTLGKLLDPLADKLLIAAALIALVENRLAPAWATVIIIGREFAVTGLRSIAASEGVVIAAQWSGKIKMWAQVLAVAFLIVAGAQGHPPVDPGGQPFPVIKFWTVPELRAAFAHLQQGAALTAADWDIIFYSLGRAMLWVAVLASLYSLWDYFQAFYRQILTEKGAAKVTKSLAAPVSPGK
jgi:CDP-diacylglycerol--glycerol-3-phosphate 3-phosphatidyltransferase